MASVESKILVLVVEDEPLLRINAVTFIEDAGYEVLEAGTADHAIELLESHPDIGIVFSDIDLPGSLNGIRLCAVVNRRWPPIKLILTSGMLRHGDKALPQNLPFLSKPYSPEDLLGALAGPAPRA